MKLSGLWYYGKSIPILLRGIRNLGEVFHLVNPDINQPRRIHLADGSCFFIRSLMDLWVLKETCLDRQYEKFGVNIQNGWTVVDVGGGWGDFAISVARRNPKSRVIAFEPYPPSANLFETNQLENQASNVELVKAAIGKENGRTQLSIQKKEAVQHSTAKGEVDGGVMVECLSLETAFERLNIECCEFLKMDCEGGEYDILFFAPSEVLNKINRICMETHDGVTRFSHQDLIRFLTEQGYQVRFKVNPVHTTLGLLFAERSGVKN